jgi:hypothetical protein
VTWIQFDYSESVSSPASKWLKCLLVIGCHGARRRSSPDGRTVSTVRPLAELNDDVQGIAGPGTVQVPLTTHWTALSK